MIPQSLWRTKSYPRLPHRSLPDEVDVAVIGGGITGLSAAYLLKRAGKRVAVLDREIVGGGESGNTSAHLTYVTDKRITELTEQFGAEVAAHVWRAGESALDLIERVVHEANIDCGFQRVSGYLCAPFLGKDGDEPFDALVRDAENACVLGFDARIHRRGPLTGFPAMELPNQALFQPLDYLHGLAIQIDDDGSFVCEGCEVGDVIDDPLAVIVDGRTIACKDVVIATNVPMVGIRGLVGATLFQTKLYPYSSYVMAGAIDDESLIPGLYSDTDDPYYYLRVHDEGGRRYAVFGGRDHKTGKEADPSARYEELSEVFQALVPSATVQYCWSGQVVETADGLPYIGEVAPHQYIATGYGGNGLTFGTVAAMMIRDAITGEPNPWRDVFDPKRKASSVSAVAHLVRENADYPIQFMKDRLTPHDGSGVENVPRGAGKIISVDGQRVAVHRRDDGSVVKVSAVCTHMGCLVRWNDAERTWDCPCHGSRFTAEGLVLGGPAEAPLEEIK